VGRKPKPSKNEQDALHEFVTAPARDDLPSPVQFLADPLSKTSRLERRNLLISAAAGILVASAGLLPTRFTTFGLEFQQPEQRVLIAGFIVLILYFLFGFVVYAVADFLIWRKTYQDYLEGVERLASTWSQEDQRANDEMQEHVPDIAWLYRVSHPAAFARIIFEFVFPIMGAVLAILLLADKIRTLRG
jgi:hypothetical protein